MKNNFFTILPSLLLSVFLFSSIISCDRDKLDFEDDDTVTNNGGTNNGNGYDYEASGSANGHEYVDLGLSVKWATCNVGANSPEEYGDYFAWGETTPKSCYTIDNNVTHGAILSDIGGDARYDAACANWGSAWRLPTESECNELLDNCTWTWTTLNGYNGYRVTSKKNGNSIFLPAAGDRSYKSWDVGSNGSYWHSSIHSYDSPTVANGFCFTVDFQATFNGSREVGNSVRPVLKQYSDANLNPKGKIPSPNDYGVDLGLSVYWADYNVGSTESTEIGGCYGWGDVTGTYYTEDETMYPNSNPPSDISGTEYDIAQNKWGNGWRIPTKEEMEELIDNCDITWLDWCKCWEFYSKINGNSIKLPYAPVRDGRSTFYDECGYWTSTLDRENNGAYALYTLKPGRVMEHIDHFFRSYGCQIRPVKDKK